MSLLNFDLPTEVDGLIAALAVGLIIGLERGWTNREITEGGRVAGMRTFALTGLLGGVLGLLQPVFGPWPLLAALLGLSLLLAVSYSSATQQARSLSITTAVTMVLTMALGVLAAQGQEALALAASVVTAVILSLKPTLHGWLRVMEHRELNASLQLLVLSVVILPYLPNKGMGPYDALNPYELWLAVILIAGLSLAGHFAMRLTGAHRGLLWTGLLGGLASSTAATLTLARFAARQPATTHAAAAGALAASGVMFFRMSVLLGVMGPTLLRAFGAPLVVAGVLLIGMALWKWRHARNPASADDAHSADKADDEVEAMSPFDLVSAFGFAAFLAIMAVLVPAAKQWLGASGIYALSAVSGLADVDAILISLARQHGSGTLPTAVAVIALGLAALSNTVTKGVMAWVTGGTAFGRPVALGYAVALLGAAITIAVMLGLG